MCDYVVSMEHIVGTVGDFVDAFGPYDIEWHGDKEDNRTGWLVN